MYPVSNIFADFVRRRDRQFKVKALINGVEYYDDVIVDFTVENSIVSADEFEIGTVIPSQLTIKLRMQDQIPANARIIPYLNLDLSSMTWDEAEYPWSTIPTTWLGTTTEWIPVGEFYVDSREKVNDVWSYTCFDKLMFANVAYVSSLTYPATYKAVWDEICTRLGYTYDSSVVINSSFTFGAGPAGFTAIQIMGYIAGANNASVFVGKDGVIRFKRFFANAPGVFNFTGTDYIRTPKQTNPVKTYTRVVVTYDEDDDLYYEAGTGDENHTLYMVNPFATQVITNSIQAALNGFSYQPITGDAIGVPHLDQGDIITYEQDESRPWDDTIVAWQDDDLPWNGLRTYKTILLHQTLSFAGGLKMALEAPSKSEQQSEFKIDGSLTTAVNDINKTAVKQGKNYYGVTITRTDGLTVEREDGASKVILNSDEFIFYADGQEALYFDLPSRKFKFAGDLEAAGGTFTGTLVGVDGEFSGTITASTIIGTDIQGSNIIGSTIIGSVLKTAQSGRRIEINATGLGTFDSNGNNRIAMTTSSDNGIAAISFFSDDGYFQGEINAYQSSGLSVFSDNLFLGSNNTGNPIYFAGAPIITGPSDFRSLVTIGSIIDVESLLISLRGAVFGA